MKKLNCWEFKNCKRQLGGEKVLDSGLCPAVVEISLAGVHDGEFGGRACWMLAGTLCKGEVQRSFEEKYAECKKCDFYEYVKQQEEADFLSIVALLKIIADYKNQEL